jgi:tRNA(Ile)-lysidine synthase
MLENTYQFIQPYLTNKKNPVVVGVSGGPDSLVLLHLLVQMGANCIVGHVHHGIREDADGDLTLVQRYAATWDVPFYVKRFDITKIAARTKQSIEEAGRNNRYQFLFDLAVQFQGCVVFVGHTADDQVETVLMHFLRGSGLDGLRGMQLSLLPNPWSKTIPLVRPLLGVWRTEIETYCQVFDLLPAQDVTNTQTEYLRNKLRHQLLPNLTEYNPQVKKAIWKLAAIVGDDAEVIKEVLQGVWSRVVLEESLSRIVFDRKTFCSLNVSSKRGLVREAVLRLRGDLDGVNFEQVERILGILSTDLSTGQFHLGRGVRLVLVYSQFAMEYGLNEPDVLAWPQLSESSTMRIILPGYLLFPGGWLLEAKWVQLSQLKISEIKSNIDPFKAWLGFENRFNFLEIRPRKPADRISPLGLSGRSQKLSDLMINKKLPAAARERWPLITWNGEIIWVPGFCIAHEHQIHDKTAQILYLSLQRTDDLGSHHP